MSRTRLSGHFAPDSSISFSIHLEWSTVQQKSLYKAFISYSHHDVRWAHRIHRFLETYSIPRRLVGQKTQHGMVPKKLRPIFKDRDELPSASDLNKVVNEALEASEFLIVICSPDSASSHWVNEEVLTFKRLGRADRILSIIIDGEPGASGIPGRESEECFCPALRFRLDQRDNLSDESAEPVAADVRIAGDGYKLARLKLAAGLLGVGLDDLRQRQLQRRIRRMGLITTASVAGMVITLMLALAAETARKDAERRREQADDLIGFMLGDLHEKLNEVGRLDVLDSVAEKTMAYFAEYQPKELTDEALANRAEALLQLGQVQMARGEFEAALAPFEESLNATRELSTRDPGNLDRLFELGQAQFWVGYVQWEFGELDAANDCMLEYYRVSEVLYNADPTNDDYIAELGSSFANLAILNDRLKDNEAAQDYSERAVNLNRTAFERDRQNNAYQLALAEALSWNGTLLRNNLQFAASSARFDEYLALSKEALTRRPDDSQWRDHRMLTRHFAGENALDIGQLVTALEHYSSGAKLADQLVQIEPENSHWQIEHTLLLRDVAKEALRQGQVETGMHALSSARSKVSLQLEQHPESVDWRALESRLNLILASVFKTDGNIDGANELVDQVITNARDLVEINPRFKTARILLANALIFSAKIQGPELVTEERTAALDEAARVLNNDLIDATNPEVMDAMVRTYLQAGDQEKAAEFTKSLIESGYRHPDFMAVVETLGNSTP